MVLALGVLTPFFQYIPKAALGAVILSSVIHMVDYKIVKKIWQTKKTDVLPLFVTFGLCLYDIATGIVCGILTALLLLMYRLVVPRIEARQQEVTVIRINGGLSYVGIEYLISKVEEVRIICGDWFCLLQFDFGRHCKHLSSINLVQFRFPLGVTLYQKETEHFRTDRAIQFG